MLAFYGKAIFSKHLNLYKTLCVRYVIGYRRHIKWQLESDKKDEYCLDVFKKCLPQPHYRCYTGYKAHIPLYTRLDSISSYLARPMQYYIFCKQYLNGRKCRTPMLVSCIMYCNDMVFSFTSICVSFLNIDFILFLQSFQMYGDKSRNLIVNQ